MRSCTTMGAVLLGLALAHPVAAADLTVNAFFGQFAGSGIAKSDDSLYFGVTVRDLDVTIRPDGRGFSVAWTTVMRSGGTPAKPDVRRKATTMVFQPAERPGVYRAADSGDPLAGKTLGWARIAGNSLFVYVMGLTEKNQYEVQTYQRTLSGSGMDLKYVMVRDGEPVRVVNGKLVKQAN